MADMANCNLQNGACRADGAAGRRTSATLLILAVALSLWRDIGALPAQGRLCHEGREHSWRGMRGEIVPYKRADPVDGRFPKLFAYSKGEHCDAQPELRFDIDDCKLADFDPLMLISRLRGRRLVLWGDSVSRQMFEYMRARIDAFAEAAARPPLPSPYDYTAPRGCRFEKTKVQFAFNIARKGMSVTRSGRQSFRTLSRSCYSRRESIDRHCFSYPAHAFKLCYVSARDHVIDGHNVAIFQTISASDIVLANIGLHRNDASRLRMALKRFVLQLAIFKHQRMPLPRLLWRTTSAQHFHNEKGGHWPSDPQRAAALQDVRAYPGGYKCQARPYAEMRAHNWRNEVAEELLRPLKIPVLDVWNLTALHPTGHPQLLHDMTKADCTHWCANPGGLLEVWVQLLQDLLFTLLRSPLEASPELIVPPRLLGQSVASRHDQ